jgi:hypothetical protein
MTPSGAGGNCRTCSERASKTTSGRGTVLTLLAVLGGPNVGACPRSPVNWRSTNKCAPEEVHPVERQAEDLTLSQTGARREDDHGPIAFWDRLDQCLYLRR